MLDLDCFILFSSFVIYTAFLFTFVISSDLFLSWMLYSMDNDFLFTEQLMLY